MRGTLYVTCHAFVPVHAEERVLLQYKADSRGRIGTRLALAELMERANQKLQLAILALTVVLATSGCGEGFGVRPSLGGGYKTNDPALREFLVAAQAVPVTPEETKAGSSKTLTWLGETTPLVKYEASLDVDFEDLARAFGLGEKIARIGGWRIDKCSRAGSSLDMRPAKSKYDCDEIPYGDIVNARTKIIETFDFPKVEGKQSGVEYKVSATSVPLFLSRDQRPAVDKILDLTSKTEKQIDVSADILENIYYRFSVDGGTLISDVCLHSPGLTFSSDKTHIDVDAEKKLWIVSLRAEGHFGVRPGTLSFSKAKVCSRFETSVSNKGADFKFQSMETPQFTDLKHQGLDIDVDVDFKGILKVISNIVKIVGIDIEKKVQQKVEKKVMETADDKFEEIKKEDLETGQWLVKYVNGPMFKGKVIKNLEAGAKSASSRRGAGSLVLMNSMIEAGCVLLGRQYKESLRGEFEKVCRNSFEVRAKIFADSPEDRAKGCYDSYFASRDVEVNGQKPWWAKECRLHNSIEITAPEDLAPLYSCISRLMKKDGRDLLNADACAGEIQFLEKRLGDIDFSDFVDIAKDEAKGGRFETELQDFLKDKYKDLF